ncbi:MAG: porin [Candidatus Latescibacteria bacterium]|nr:porin [Candidatus Latescibacterota bacterium]
MRYHRLSLFTALGLMALGPLQPVRAAAPDSLFQALDQRVKILERLHELDQEAAAAKAKDTPVVSASSKDGFTLKSPDSSFKLKIGGYSQGDGRFWLGDEKKARTNTFLLRRVRPQFDGTVGKYVDFRVMPDFGGGATVLYDAYLNFNYRPGFKVQVGKFKPPVGLERLQSGAALLFVERGLPTSLVPNRDLGLQVHGDLGGGLLSYAVGLFNGVVDGGNADIDVDDSKDLAARLFAQPFKQGTSLLQGLSLGLAGSWGNTSGALPAYKTPGQVSFFTYTDTTVADGSRLRLAPQFTYYTGPLGLLGEYTVSKQKVVRKTDSATLQHRAWQLAASYLLSGDQATFKGVSPKKSFDPGKGQWGALELAGRFHKLAIDKDAYPIFANPKKSASSATAWSLGLNWHLSKNTKLNLDYEQTQFADGDAKGDRDAEKILFNRFQVAF